MALKYICSNCGKTFNSEEFARLAQLANVICEVAESRHSDIRKCDYCGKEINDWRF